MSWSFQQIGETALTVLAVLVIIVAISLWLWSVRDKKALAIRLGVTLVLTSIVYITVAPLMSALGYGMIAGLFIVVIYGWLMAITWGMAITGYVGKLFGNLYDGGDVEVEPAPFFSIFNAKRQKGKYFDALAEIRRQLKNFPADFQGHMLLAELQAENLDDLPGAALTIQRACELPDQTPQNIAFALSKLADWHLGLTKDREAAKQTLEKLIATLPDTEYAARASQRIAHLADIEMLLAPHDRQKIEVKRGVVNLGLNRGADGRLRTPEVDYEKLAAEYAAQLERHPLDTHAREQLAVIFAKFYQRADLALEQLEHLVQQPNQSAKQVAHWLNLMADMQVHGGANEEQARATLQRIIDAYPDSAAALAAQRRMDMLKLELKAQEKRHDVQMGVYEQNIGLKRRV
jgi:outer membrane protein assembly factor BamD (BamD/ComL family)